MTDHEHDHTSLDPIAARLRAAKPELTPLELDGVKQRVVRLALRPRGGASTKKGSFMRARVTILAMLVFGLLMIGTSGALAVSGISDSGSAAKVQYPSNHTGPALNTLAAQQNGQPNDNDNGTPSSSTGPSNSSGTPASSDAQQAAAGSGKQLPFTGYLAIPVLLGGIALLGTGMMMRRRTRSDG